ncbi:hypothetical protein Tdes44962_MAKER00302 [Teratosphaeria destructans]|uniref:Uncharacterized protein n=1 Tax=Teratosphaeria destructans TaxID=418781 RepID=A0A9W7SVK0_9PEZI|nr:hypothetical protein Tdes44962_MAKER00302 [Teratosphaeria destructans]
MSQDSQKPRFNNPRAAQITDAHVAAFRAGMQAWTDDAVREFLAWIVEQHCAGNLPSWINLINTTLPSEEKQATKAEGKGKRKRRERKAEASEVARGIIEPDGEGGLRIKEKFADALIEGMAAEGKGGEEDEEQDVVAGVQQGH